MRLKDFRRNCLLALCILVCAHSTTRLAIAQVNDYSNDGACTPSIAYSAPRGCPDVATVQRQMTSYHFRPGSLSDCPDCVHGIVIVPETNGPGYRLEIAGLEATTVTRSDCNELAEFALYTIEASDLPPTICTQTAALVGVSAIPLLNTRNGDLLLATQVRLTIPIGSAELTPFGFWLPPSQVRNQARSNEYSLNPDWENLDLVAYGAGLDACWTLADGLLGRHGSVRICGVGLWRRFAATPSAGSAAIDAELWTVGGSLSGRIDLFDSLRLEVAPTLLTGLTAARTIDAATGDSLYQYNGLEAQVRVGFSWEIPVRRTLTKLEPSSASPHRVGLAAGAGPANHSL
jgi:hypothetical protein